MHPRNINSKESDTKMGSRSTASDIPPECLDDPKFRKILAPALCSEIDSLELLISEADAEIEGYKKNVSKGLDERKRLKKSGQVLMDKKIALSTALESLEREGRLRSFELATMKLGLDDSTQRERADRSQYKKILDNYEETWQKYKAAYEERPWAKEVQRARIDLKQHQIRLMMAEYEKDNLKKMLEQRKKIDTIRVRVSITEMSEMVLQRWKEQKHIDDLNIVAKQLQNELDVYTAELSRLKQEKEDRKRRAEIETATMPPPTLDFSFMRSIYHGERNLYKRNHPKFTPIRDSDTLSINTLMLEEMCSAPTNDQLTEEPWRKDNQPPEEDDEESLNDVSIPVLMTQELGSNNTIVNQADKTLDSYMTNQSALNTKMKQLYMENTTSDNQQEQKQSKSTKKNNSENNQNEIKDYEARLEDSHQRTRRWCEDAQDKFVPFSLVDQRSNSFNEQTKVEFMVEGCNKLAGQKIGKALSICGSEPVSLHHQKDRRNNFDKAAMEINDEASEDISLENFVSNVSRIDQIRIQNAPIAVEALRSGEKELPNKSSIPVLKTSAGNQHNYENTELKRPVLDDNVASQESKSDNNSESSIDAGCSKPKIRKIETVNYPLEQRAKNTVTINEPQPPRTSYSPRQYMPSPMGSDLSSIFAAAMQEPSIGNFGGERMTTPGFRTFSNFKNWSPPNSERSFTGSISKIGPDEENNTIQQQNQQFNMSEFFTMPSTQKPGNIF